MKMPVVRRSSKISLFFFFFPSLRQLLARWAVTHPSHSSPFGPYLPTHIGTWIMFLFVLQFILFKFCLFLWNTVNGKLKIFIHAAASGGFFMWASEASTVGSYVHLSLRLDPERSFNRLNHQNFSLSTIPYYFFLHRTHPFLIYLRCHQESTGVPTKLNNATPGLAPRGMVM